MDGAQACYPYLAVGVETMPRRVGRRGVRERSLGVIRVERPLVQILVVVANTQMRTLRTEVGKVPCEQQLDMG